MTTQPQQPGQPSPPPGWYRHPTMANTQAYWDGEQWTDHVAPKPARKNNTGLVVGGLATAFLIPLIGFIIGCVLLTRKPGAGIVIMVISLVMAGVWWGHFTSSSTNF